MKSLVEIAYFFLLGRLCNLVSFAVSITKDDLKASYVLPPSHNIRDFEFSLVTFDHSSYLIFFKIIIYFICDLLYYPHYLSITFRFFICSSI
jgi:hypothetical protein